MGSLGHVRDRNARFAGRRIYLTGAASGIGRAAAHLLASQGAALALVDVDASGLGACAAETGGTAFVVDLASGEAIDRSVAAAGDALGGLDGIINCAGLGEGTRLAELEPSLWDHVIAVNLSAPYRVCRAALPLLRREARASIVNVASGEALLPSHSGAPVYAASKGGLISFTKALAADLAPHIRANVVCPGLADTAMTAAFLHGGDGSAAASVTARYALRRAADPIEIAEAIAFLASDEASYVTGITLAADGGRSFH